MPVCEYFLKGRCKFGDRCRNEHPRGGRPNADKDVCKFFQQGNCRYGDNCRFYHPRGQTQQNSGFYRSQGGSDRNRFASLSGSHQHPHEQQHFHRGGNRYSSNDKATSYTQQSRHHGQGDLRQRTQQDQGDRWRHQQDPSPVHRRDYSEQRLDHSRAYREQSVGQRRNGMTDDVRDMILSDMTEWDYNGIWQLSSYSFNGSEQCIGDLEEFSQEEIRWEAYQAKLLGQVPEYEENLRRLLLANRTERNRLKTDRNAHHHTMVGVGNLPQGSWPHQQQHEGGILTGQLQPQQPILTESRAQTSSFTSPIIGPGIFSNEAQQQPGVSLRLTKLSQSQTQQQQPQAQPAAVQPVQAVHAKASQQPPTDDNSVHLAFPKMSEEDLLQFKGDKFVLGKVPECPPPPELC